MLFIAIGRNREHPVNDRSIGGDPSPSSATRVRELTRQEGRSDGAIRSLLINEGRQTSRGESRDSTATARYDLRRGIGDDQQGNLRVGSSYSSDGGDGESCGGRGDPGSGRDRGDRESESEGDRCTSPAEDL